MIEASYREVEGSLAYVEQASPTSAQARFTLLEGIGHYPMEELEDFASWLDARLSELAGAPAVA
jgi:hypothetical protein